MGTRRGSVTRDTGATGLDRHGGIIREDFLNDWIGRKKVDKVDEMLANSPVIGALRLAIELTIREVSWQFTSTEGEDDPRLALLNESLEGMSHSWNDHVAEALLMPFYGWSMFTTAYRRDGGRLLWRKFKMLGHDTVYRWLFDDGGGIAGLQQLPYLNPEPVPIERMILYRFRKTKNNPEGESILRPAWVPYYFTKNIQQIEAIGIERNLAGLPVVRPPQGADMEDGSKDRQRAERLVRNIRNDEQAGVTLPPPDGEGEHQQWLIYLLSVGSQGAGTSKATDTNMVISRYEKRTLMSALSQFLMLGMDSVGALATFDGGNDFFTIAVNAVADIISETFTAFEIPRLLRLNGMEANGLRLEHTAAGAEDIDVLGQTLERVAPLITWTSADEVELRQRLRLPERTAAEIDEEKERRAAALPQFPPQSNGGGDDMAAWGYAPVEFAADDAPDSDERERHEGRFNRMFRGFLERQAERVARGAEILSGD